MTIILPLCPSVNSLYNGGSKQRRFKSKGYKAWLIRANEALFNQDLIPEDFYTGKVALTYTYYFPDKRSRDCENYVKAVSDFLVANQIIEDDDCFHVPKLTIIFGGIDKLNPRVEVLIDILENPSL